MIGKSGRAILADDRTKSRTASLGFAELSIQYYTSRSAWVHVPGRPFLGCLCERDLPKDRVPRTRMALKACCRRGAQPPSWNGRHRVHKLLTPRPSLLLNPPDAQR